MSSPTSHHRPRRHGARPLAFGCLGLFGALIIAAIGYLSWSNQLPPLEPDTRVMPTPNGYDACLAAMASLEQATTIRPVPDRDTADLPTIRAALTAYRPALDAVRTALRLSFETPPLVSATVPTPELRQFRDASRAFALEARLAREEGRPGDAIQRALDAVDLGVRSERGGTFMSALVGQACTAIGVRSAEDVVPQLSAAEARAAGARLDRISQLLPSATAVLEGERRFVLLSTREMLTGQLPIATSTAAFGGTPSRWDLLKERALLFVYPKRWGYQRMDRYFRELIEEFRKPYASRQEPASQIPDNDPVLGGNSMFTAQISFQLARHEQLLRLLRVQLALEEARQSRGRYPATLQDLTPKILREVPTDPFDGQPLRYRPQGNSYLLYSVGPDLKDNGGTPISARFLSPTASGDLVAGKQWSQPRPKPGIPQK